MKYINGGVTAAKGFVASGIHCGIRKNKTKRDLALVMSETKASAAAVENCVKLRVTHIGILCVIGILSATLPGETIIVTT